MTPTFLPVVPLIGLLLGAVFICVVIVLLVKRPLIGGILLFIGVAILFLGMFVAIPRESQPTVSFNGIRVPVDVRPAGTSRPPMSYDDRTIEIPDLVISSNTITAHEPTTFPSDAGSKLWVDDWAQYANQNSRAWQMVRVESSDTCTTVDEAREQAISRAVQQLRPLVLSRMQSTPGRMLQVNQLDATIAASLRNGQGVVDQYVRENKKPYGTLWKYYLLVDRSPATIDPIAARFGNVVAIRTSRDITTWGSLAALVLVIVLVYAFLNSATKGYFVWRLRTAMILLSIVAVLVVMARF